MYDLSEMHRRADRLPAVVMIALIVCLAAGCSRDHQPIAEAVKPAQQTMEAAKGVEQTLRQAQENREAQSPKE